MLIQLEGGPGFGMQLCGLMSFSLYVRFAFEGVPAQVFVDVHVQVLGVLHSFKSLPMFILTDRFRQVNCSKSKELVRNTKL